MEMGEHNMEMGSGAEEDMEMGKQHGDGVRPSGAEEDIEMGKHNMEMGYSSRELKNVHY